MVYDGYMQFGTTEIINSSRAAAYAASAGVTVVGCQSCQSMGPALGQYYSDPVTDNAPWIDAALPQSRDFLGYVGLAVSGVTVGTGSRRALSRATDGSVLGNLHNAHRELRGSAVGISRSEPGMSYGISWLSNVLRANSRTCPPPGCQGLPVTVEAWCPDCTQAGGCNGSRRTMFDGNLMEGPEVSVKRRIGSTCAGYSTWMFEIDFLIATGLPFLYYDPIVIASNVHLSAPTLWPCVDSWHIYTGTETCTLPDCSTPISTACVTWTPWTDPSCNDPCKQNAGTCLITDPLCPVPLPPVQPNPTVDPCTCLISMNPVASTALVPLGTLPSFGEMVPVITVTAGSADMRRFLVRFYHNNNGQPCVFSNLSDCDIAGEVGIPYLPAGSTLVIDGRNQQALVTCADGRIATPQLYTTNGPMAVWPVIGCGKAWCVAIMADGDFVSTDATVSVAVAIREDVC